MYQKNYSLNCHIICINLHRYNKKKIATLTVINVFLFLFDYFLEIIKSGVNALVV